MRLRSFVLAWLVAGAAGAATACASATAMRDASALDATWELIELNGEPVGPGANGRRATLRLDTDGRASGSAGCNRYGGEYTMDGAELRFSELGMTRMFCEGFMDLEQRFSAALQNTRGWRIADDRLELTGDDRVLARLARS